MGVGNCIVICATARLALTQTGPGEADDRGHGGAERPSASSRGRRSRRPLLNGCSAPTCARPAAMRRSVRAICKPDTFPVTPRRARARVAVGGRHAVGGSLGFGRRCRRTARARRTCASSWRHIRGSAPLATEEAAPSCRLSNDAVIGIAVASSSRFARRSTSARSGSPPMDERPDGRRPARSDAHRRDALPAACRGRRVCIVRAPLSIPTRRR